MIRKTLVAFVLAVSLAALAATLVARPSGAAHRKYTIAYFGYGYVNMASIREEAKRLGVRVLFPKCNGCSPQDGVRQYESMIARHVDAIVTAGFDPTLKPTFRKVRKAGILLISSGDDIAGKRDLWVSQSDPVAYGEALADALASQIGKKGEYAILDEQGEFPIAHTWKKIVEAYIPKAYPNMKLVGAPTETGAGDENEVNAVKSFMDAHPNLKGLIGIPPTEAYMAAEAITQAGRIGQVFSAGNGGTTPVDPQLAGYVRSGAAELVYASDTIKQGYLTVWAAHYLLTGHRFRPGAYQVGGPIGRVWYYAKHSELRLGQPLTITKKNVDQYANKF
jgi:rhamnose transport system substrate-binding protein